MKCNKMGWNETQKIKIKENKTKYELKWNMMKVIGIKWNEIGKKWNLINCN